MSYILIYVSRTQMSLLESISYHLFKIYAKHSSFDVQNLLNLYLCGMWFCTNQEQNMFWNDEN